jgi:hypothetical protein
MPHDHGDWPGFSLEQAGILSCAGISLLCNTRPGSCPSAISFCLLDGLRPVCVAADWTEGLHIPCGQSHPSRISRSYCGHSCRNTTSQDGYKATFQRGRHTLTWVHGRLRSQSGIIACSRYGDWEKHRSLSTWRPEKLRKETVTNIAGQPTQKLVCFLLLFHLWVFLGYVCHQEI